MSQSSEFEFDVTMGSWLERRGVEPFQYLYKITVPDDLTLPEGCPRSAVVRVDDDENLLVSYTVPGDSVIRKATKDYGSIRRVLESWCQAKATESSGDTSIPLTLDKGHRVRGQRKFQLTCKPAVPATLNSTNDEEPVRIHSESRTSSITLVEGSHLDGAEEV